MTQTFRGNLHASVAGRDGKYGGRSPYTDLDVARAREYLTEMGKDPDVDLEGRSAAHMIAEFACFWLNDLKSELRKQAAKDTLSRVRGEGLSVESLEAGIACFDRVYKDI